jgi:peptidoglycan/LPS O-acetylase OafA/YrhL
VPHRPGIDGLRAIAVIAVVLYHADISWLPAGFLGVDVFFVISGYLICSLLLAEWQATGNVALGSFWNRRARRLLPALAALLAGVTAAALLFAPDAVTRLRADLLPAMAYVSNWWQIWRGESYFEAFGRAPLLRHLWSLAVEEQFYVLFPLVFVVVMRAGRRYRRVLLAALAIGAGIASSVAMAVWYPAGHDPSRVYYGTDTRAVGLCAGVALACLWPLGRPRSSLRTIRRAALDITGVASLALLVALMARLNDYTPTVFRGGFAWCAVTTAALVAVLAHPASRLGRLLGREPFRWIGLRSYAIYLWHWPVFMLTRPRADLHLGRWPVFVLQLALTAVLAEASWRLVERRFRTAGTLRGTRRERQERRRTFAIATTAVVVVLVTGLLSASAPTPPSFLSANVVSASRPLAILPAPASDVPTAATSEAAPVAQPSTSTTAGPPAATALTAPPLAGPGAAPSPPPAPPPPPPPGTVLAFGDSVMVAASRALVSGSDGRIRIDAAVGRQVDDGLDVIQRARDAGAFADISAVVVHLGSNGPMTTRQFERLTSLVAGVPRVVMVNVRVPKRWESESNDSIEHGVAGHPEMRLADWHRASGADKVLGPDGVHPTPSGAVTYARIVLAQLADAPPSPPPAAPAPPPPPTTTTTAPPPSTTSTTEAPTTTSTTTAPSTTAPPASSTTSPTSTTSSTT